MNATVILQPGRDKSVLRRHPWVFSRAISRVEGKASDGDAVTVADSTGKPLAQGLLNRRSQITIRLVSWNPGQAIDEKFWRERIRAAIKARRPSGLGEACRLIHGESDGLPGLVVDRYGEWLVVQVLTLGLDRIKSDLARWTAQALAEAQPAAPIRGVYERSDADVRVKEGLEQATGLLWGEEPPSQIEICERSLSGKPLRFLVDPRRGHKTGFYLDQSVNRHRAAAYASGAEVLNVFSYTGAFGIHALAEGAKRVVNVDSAADALTLARRHCEMNGFAANEEDFIDGDAFALLRRFRAEGRQFDLIVLDPPKFVHSAGQLDRATRAYKDLNLVAFQILRPGGTLATFSCSGLVTPDLFQKIVFGAALDSGREASIVEKLSQSPDHPIALTFPEAEYLKGLICQVR